MSCLLYSFYKCRIDSEHNRKVVDSIIKEIGKGSFSDKQIRGNILTMNMNFDCFISYIIINYIEGCRTYRKTLHEREKEKTEVDRKKMRIRSRQQRVRNL